MKIERFEDVVSPACHARPENTWKEEVIRLRQNTLQLAVGMNGGANAPKLEQRRRVGFGEFRFDTPQLVGAKRRSRLRGCGELHYN